MNETVRIITKTCGNKNKDGGSCWGREIIKCEAGEAMGTEYSEAMMEEIKEG